MTIERKGRGWRLVAVAAIIALLILFFMAPVFSYGSVHYQVAGGTYNFWTARVSGSYMALGCGLLLGTNLTETVIGNASGWFSRLMPSPMFACNYYPTEVIGQAGVWPTGPENLTVRTDESTYTGSQPILVSGTVTPAGKGWLVTVWVINPAGIEVASTSATADPSSGAYSFTLISGGTAYWIAGTYIVKVGLTTGGGPLLAANTTQFDYAPPS